MRDVPAENSINPLTRETSAVLARCPRTRLATPRAVRVLTVPLFNERQIHGVRDILVYSPGAYAGASYGKTTVPKSSRDTAETYLNGPRPQLQFLRLLPSFNGVEAVDLVSRTRFGVFGAGYFTGATFNYVSKAPSFAGPATTLTTRIGTWAPSETSFPQRLRAARFHRLRLAINSRGACRSKRKAADTFFRRNDDRRRSDRCVCRARVAASTGHEGRSLAQFMWQAAPRRSA